MTPLEEVLLTVLALSQESYKGPLSHAVPPRLSSPLRRARKLGLVHIDDAGVYLEEEGAALLQDFGGYPFGKPKRG